jgi:hypothetical protein
MTAVQYLHHSQLSAIFSDRQVIPGDFYSISQILRNPNHLVGTLRTSRMKVRNSILTQVVLCLSMSIGLYNRSSILKGSFCHFDNEQTSNSKRHKYQKNRIPLFQSIFSLPAFQSLCYLDWSNDRTSEYVEDNYRKAKVTFTNG